MQFDTASMTSGFDSQVGPVDDEYDLRNVKGSPRGHTPSLTGSWLGTDNRLIKDQGRVATAWYPRGGGARGINQLGGIYEDLPPAYDSATTAQYVCLQLTFTILFL